MKITIELSCWETNADIPEHYRSQLEYERAQKIWDLLEEHKDLQTTYSSTQPIVTVRAACVTEALVSLLEALEEIEGYYSTRQAFEDALKSREEDLAEFLLEEQTQ